MSVSVGQIESAAKKLEGVVRKTPLEFCKRLSRRYGAAVYFKREDLQKVRSFKIRGAYNKISSLNVRQKKRGVVSASTGNHAQGVALSCALLKIKGVIFMPVVTPSQKVDKVKDFGGKYVEIKMVGETFDKACEESVKYSEKNRAVYVHPYDDNQVIAGQGTIGKEIYDELNSGVDVVVSPVGGGGLVSGIASYLKAKQKKTKVIGCEPTGASSLFACFRAKRMVALKKIDTFVDGAAVNKIGKLAYKICKTHLDKVVSVDEGKVCTTMIEMYQKDGIIAEPAGALSVAALDGLGKRIKGKTVVCVISGGNNDITRYPEIMEKSLVYEGKKHYMMIEFTQKPGELRNFLDNALGPTDDIVRFEYLKKSNKETGPALVGIELKDKKDLKPLLKNMSKIGLKYKLIDHSDILYNYLV